MEPDKVLEKLKKTRLMLSNGGPQDKPIFPIEFRLHAEEDAVEEGDTQVLLDRKAILLSREDFQGVLAVYRDFVAEQRPPERVPDKLYDVGTVIGELIEDDQSKAYVFRREQGETLLRGIWKKLEQEPAKETVEQFARRMGLEVPEPTPPEPEEAGDDASSDTESDASDAPPDGPADVPGS